MENAAKELGIVMDEPTANLDVETIQTLKRMLKIMKEKGKTILVAEHRLDYLSALADRVLYISHGEIDREYLASEFFSMEDEERKTLGLRNLGGGKKAKKASGKTGKNVAMHVQGLSAGYGKKPVIEGINFYADKGEIIGIAGKNGTGKSTLCRVLCGLARQKEGKILNDESIALTLKRRCKESFSVMQDVNHQLFGESVYEECLMNAGDAKEP